MKVEYDFLGVINDHIRIYKEFLLPAVICDTSFEVCWSNPAAKKLYPHLTSQHGLDILIGEFDHANLLSRLKSEGTLRIDGTLAFSGARLNLVPIQVDGDVAGIVVLLVEPASAPDVVSVAKSSRTPAVLESGIRQGIEEIFRIMDAMSLKADMLEAGWIKSSLNGIAQSGYGILRLASNLSQFTQYQIQPPDLSLRSEDVFSLLRESADIIMSLSEEIGIPVRFDLPTHPVVTEIDSGKLQLAIFNILHNASYFTKPGNSVDIIGSYSDDAVKIVIRDRGRGIAPDVLPYIFDPYFSAGHDNMSAGIGLGLPAAKAIIEAHSGTINVESVENEGTTVTITLPAGSFSKPLTFAQGRSIRGSDRFSQIYIGLAGVASSPYRDAHD